MNDFDKLRERVEAAKGLRLVENPSGVMGIAPSVEVFISGGGGYGIGKFEVYKTEFGILAAHKILDGLEGINEQFEAQAKARRCVDDIILLLHSVAEPTQIGGLIPPPYGKQVAQGAIDIIRREFNIEEAKR